MKVIASNRRAKFDYEITDTLVAGVVLTGAEVKSTKQGHISLKGSYITVNRGELYLFNAHITPYKPASDANADPEQPRKLLVHKRELKKLIAARQNGDSMVPLRVGIEHGFIKIEVGVGRGRKKTDKRQALRTREASKAMRRAKNR